LLYALAIVCGYLAGSLPFGYWLARMKGVDIRSLGSGNIGATNVWRVLGSRFGLPVMLLDIGKGLAPALVFSLTAGHVQGALAGAGAIAGHYRPVFLRFQKGGKMVATAGGVLFALAPDAAAIGTGIWIAVVLITHYASVASLTGMAAVPVSSYLLGDPWPATAFAAGAFVGVVLLHRPNLGRLLAGTENRTSLRIGLPRGRAAPDSRVPLHRPR
jgi:acyl phosphate:glycerol-3-phosphate acyltransferase